VLIAMSNIIVLSVSPRELGIQTGMNQTFRNLGSAVGPVLAAAITASFTTQVLVAVAPPPVPLLAISVPAIAGFEVLFGITAAIAVIGLVLSLGLRNYRFDANGTRSTAPSAAVGKSPSPTGESAPAVSAGRSS